MGRLSKRALQKKETIRKLRETEQFHQQEKENNKIKKRIDRESESTHTAEKRKILQLNYMRKRLENPEFKELNKSNSLNSMRKRLQDPKFKELNKASSLNSMRKRLQDPKFKELNKASSLNSMRKRLQDPKFKELNKASSLNSMRKRLQDPKFKELNKVSSLNSMRKRLQDPKFKELNKVSSLNSMGKLFKDPKFKELNKANSLKSMNKRLKDPVFLKTYTIVNRNNMRKRRIGSNSSINSNSKISKRKVPNTTLYRRNEQRKLNETRHDKDVLIAEYNLKKTQGLSEKCFSCYRLRFPSSINACKTNVLKQLGMTLSNDNADTVPICTSCHPYLRKSNIPPLYIGNGYKLNDVPTSVTKLNQIEKQMVSLRLPFMKIFKCLRSEGQLKIKGNVVNVPIDLTKTTSILPRRAENLTAIKMMKVKLKRKSCFKQHYLYQNVRPSLVVSALNDLINKPLYEDAEIDKDWLNHVSEATKNINNNLDLNENGESDGDVVDIEPVNPGSMDTMIENSDYISFAPGEGMKPLSILIDDHAEEKAFPDLFGGCPRSNKTPLKNYSKVVRSELLNVDRRFAADSSNIFFKCKVLIQKQIASNVQIVLRKNKKERTTASDVANPATLNKMIDNDQGYRMLHNVQNSPSYLAAMRKNVFAMVRQEGQPTLFLTFSPSESTWTDLLKILYKLHHSETISDDQAINLTYAQKSDLIRLDPVVCATYFDHRFRAIFKLIKAKNGIFKEHNVKHFFYRVEYQHRGSPHVHMLLWLENAPIFDPAKPETFAACVTLIDKYITCSVEENSNAHQYIQKNTHRHTHTCYRTDKDKENKKCRFNIPYPPMNETCILTPLTDDNSNHNTRINRLLQYEKLLQFLRDYQDTDTSPEPTLNDILKKLSIQDVNEYKSIIRTAIKRPTVFLKRTIKQRLISGFNEELFPLWQSNMDIQFILDVYSCVRYVIEYIGKSQRGISKLMRDIVENLKTTTDLPVKEQLWKIASTFSGSQEISAQEAVYTCLGMKQSNSSTGHIFINTSHPDKRTRMLKPIAVRGEMDPKSDDIYVEGLLEHYSRRPYHLEDKCLAEFGANYEVRSRKKPTKNNSGSDNNDTDDESDTTYSIDSTLIGIKNKCIHKRKVRKIIRYVRFNVDKNEQDFYRENIMLFLPWRNETTDLLDINCKEVYEKNIDQIKEIYRQFNIIEETQLEDTAIDIEQEQGSNDNEVQNKDDWVPDDQLINDVGDFDETRNTPEGDAPKDCGKMSVHKIDNEQFINIIKCLNVGQRELLYHTTYTLRQQLWGKSVSPLRAFVTGPAGAGKSMLIRALAQSVIRIANLRPDIDDLSLPPILLTAPTGKAAYGIRGLTLHSAFSLPLNQYAGVLPKLSSDISNTLRCKFANIKLLIIDEISMVGIKTLGYIDQRLRSILRINKPFGDINIIVFGDFFQLPPVLSTPLYDSFDDILTKYPSAIEVISIKAIWETFKFYELTEIMRQKDDKQFAIMLTKLARGQLEEVDVKFFQNLIMSLNMSFQPRTMHLWATNKEVDEMNTRVLNSLNQVGFISEAIDTSAKQTDIEFAKKLPRQKTMGLPIRLVLKETAKYMVIANILTEDGIVNGAIGELMQINKGKTKGGKEVAKRVWIKFDEAEVGSITRQQIKDKLKPEGEFMDDWCNWTPIEITKLQFQLGNAEHRTVTRMQLPLVEALALTVHKSQGATYENVSFHIPKKYLKCNMLYVGCSRATSAQGLRIDHFPAKPPKPSIKVLNEMFRLRTPNCALKPRFSEMLLNAESLLCMSHNIRSLKKYESHINADNILLQSKLMFFQETGSKPTDVYIIKDHVECCRIDSVHANGKSGSICFIGQSICQKEIITNPILIQEKNTHLEALEICIENINYIGIYASSKFPIQSLCRYIEQIMNTNTNNIFIGDFNINFNKPPKMLVQLLQNMNYKVLVKEITTDYGTTIDNVITNVDIAALVYESLISDHRPILLLDMNTYMQIENSSELVEKQCITEVLDTNFNEEINIILEKTQTTNEITFGKSNRKSHKDQNSNQCDEINFIQIDEDTLLAPEDYNSINNVINNINNIILEETQINNKVTFKKSNSKSHKDQNSNQCDEINFIQIDEDTLLVPEDYNSVDNINNVIFETSKRSIDENIQQQVIHGFKNNDNVSCYANSIMQALFHCESLVNEIRNNQLGTTLQQSLLQYNNVQASETWPIRQYLDNDESIIFTRREQQDCVQFLEALMNRHRYTFDTLFGFQELYKSRCNLCNYTANDNAPTSLIKHLDIPENRTQTLEQLMTNDQNSWLSISDYSCPNCNNIGGFERKCEISLANEYLIIQLKLFVSYSNGQYVSTKITNLKLNGVPTTNLVIAGSQYTPHAAIFHVGQETDSGHYIAYLKQAHSKWICANDINIGEQRWPKNGKDVYVIILKRVL